MKLLPPIKMEPKYYEPIEKEIMLFLNQFYRILFQEINAETSIFEYENAKDALADAISAGTVDYDGGELFTGNFNAAISRQLKALGGVYNKVSSGWRVPRIKIPASVSMAKARADDRFTRMRKAILKTLDDSTIDSIFAHHFKTSYLQEKYEQAIQWMEGDFQKTVRAITIAPKLTDKQKKNIATEWTNNLKLYIRGWTRENTVNLRAKVQKNAFSGQRAANMVKMIQDNYGVAQSKAKFLARQETSLLMSKFREERYKDVGIQKYKWSTSGDERVREDHKHLDGKIFLFASPPIVNRRTGKRGNPGEDFECRCQARPVWD